jgi:hypothetical protein
MTDTRPVVEMTPTPWWRANVKAQTDVLVESYLRGNLTPHQLLGALYAGINP